MGKTYDVAELVNKFGTNLGSVGYQKLPSGLIIQWGLSDEGTVTLPITFPNAFLSVVATIKSTATDPANGTDASIVDNSSFTMYYGYTTGTQQLYWIAIGY